MKNRKAWLKIVEAFMAIILITVVMMTSFFTRIPKPDKEYIIQIEDSILNEISSNSTLRGYVINAALSTPEDPHLDDPNLIRINYSISKKVPPSLSFSVKICSLSDPCAMSSYRENADVFARERVISSTVEHYDPRKVRIFMWEKSR
jgi:hypothetical protein